MFYVVTDGLYVLYKYSVAITAFFVAIFGIGYYSTGIVLSREIDVKIRLLASFGVGCIFLSLLSFIFINMSQLWGFPLRVGSFAILLFAVVILLRGFWLREFKIVYSLRVFTVAIALFFLLVARLAFLKQILLPPYSDSPIHYQIIFSFLHPASESISKLSLQTIFSNYYHFGFHSLVTWLTSITEFEPDKMISLTGQLFLVVASISIISLVYTLSRSFAGALFAGLLAAVGWLMPAFAVNWGKYPALASIATMPVIVSLTLLFLDGKLIKPGNLFYGLIILVGVTFIHTRILICLFFVFVSFLVVSKLKFTDEFGLFRSIRFSLLFVLFMWPLSRLFIDFYNNTLVLIIVLGLMPFAFNKFPSASVGVLIFLSGLSLAALIPNIFNTGGKTLLDRQFIAMILYIPLSLIGGLGCAGLIRGWASSAIMKHFIVSLLYVLVFINIAPQEFYPDRCCNYFKENDKLAFEWIKENTSSHILYYISTINNDGRAYGSDAGVWISPLTGIPSNKMPFSTDWSSENIFHTVCPEVAGNVYIYAGGERNSFDDSQLARLKWATPVFQSGEVVIYKISNCTADTGKE